MSRAPGLACLMHGTPVDWTDAMTSHQFDLTSTRHYARQVRTTLSIDDDVLEAALCIAVDSGLDVGEILSRLARRGLEPHPAQRVRARDDLCPALPDQSVSGIARQI